MSIAFVVPSDFFLFPTAEQPGRAGSPESARLVLSAEDAAEGGGEAAVGARVFSDGGAHWHPCGPRRGGGLCLRHGHEPLGQPRLPHLEGHRSPR